MTRQDMKEEKASRRLNYWDHHSIAPLGINQEERDLNWFYVYKYFLRMIVFIL
jgi:hypothetical protein